MWCQAAVLPVHRDGSHGVYRGKHGRDGEEVLKATVAQAKVPVVVKSIDKVEKRVKGRHGNVGEGQVDDEIIGDGSHASVGQNDPDDGDVSRDGHQDDKGVRYSP